jgi:hypothetical protein
MAHMKTTILYPLFSILALALSACSNMTPDQQAQLSASGTVVAQKAADIALDEAAWRLRHSRTADPKN